MVSLQLEFALLILSLYVEVLCFVFVVLLLESIPGLL